MTAHGLKSMLASLSPVPIAPVMENIRLGKPVDVQTLDAAREFLRASPDGSDAVLAGVIASERARAAGIRTPEGQQWLKIAVADFRGGLSRAPTDGLSWLRLASSEFLLKSTRPQIMSAMRMGMFTARRNQRAIPIALSLSIVLWPELDADLQQYAIKTVREQWAVPRVRKGMRKLALTENGRTILRTSIGEDPELDQWIQYWIDLEARMQKKRNAQTPR